MPFNRSRFRIFYGWWIVAASFLIALYMAGIVFYGFTAIFEPIADEMGWSYVQISLAASLRGLEMGILAPVLGILVDRTGPRRIVFAGAIITAGGLLLLGRTTSLGMFYAAFVLVAIGLSCCATTVLITAVVKWFRRKVGIAIGIVISGFGFGGLMVPLIIRLIELYGWRTTMTIFAISALVIILPLSLLFRHKPEQYGYLPDGQSGVSKTVNDPVPVQTFGVEIKVKQAMKSITFWRMTLSVICHMMVISAVVTHVMPYLSSIGIDRSMSGFVATALPLVSIGGRIGGGPLGDKFDKRYVAAGTFAMIGLGLLCFAFTDGAFIWLLLPFLILFGLGYGSSNSIRPSLVMDYFGRNNFGTIFGLMIGIGMIGGMAGAPLAGWVYDNWGSYYGIWFAYVGVALVGMISVFNVSPVKAEVPVTR